MNQEEMEIEIACLRQWMTDLTTILIQTIDALEKPERNSVVRYIHDNLIIPAEQDLEGILSEHRVGIAHDRTLGIIRRRIKFLKNVRRNLDREGLY